MLGLLSVSHYYSCSARFTGKYFDEISQDTGRYCFGVNDTLKSLEMGAVEILIVWENLEVTRYVLKDHSADSESPSHATFIAYGITAAGLHC